MTFIVISNKVHPMIDGSMNKEATWDRDGSLDDKQGRTTLTCTGDANTENVGKKDLLGLLVGGGGVATQALERMFSMMPSNCWKSGDVK